MDLAFRGAWGKQLETQCLLVPGGTHGTGATARVLLSSRALKVHPHCSWSLPDSCVPFSFASSPVRAPGWPQPLGAL